MMPATTTTPAMMLNQGFDRCPISGEAIRPVLITSALAIRCSRYRGWSKPQLIVLNYDDWMTTKAANGIYTFTRRRRSAIFASARPVAIAVRRGHRQHGSRFWMVHAAAAGALRNPQRVGLGDLLPAGRLGHLLDLSTADENPTGGGVARAGA